MLCTIEIICDKYIEGFTIDSFIDNILVNFIRVHPREVKVNQYTFIWLFGNTSGPRSRWYFGNIILYGRGEFIKYFRSSVDEIWDSISIFVSVVQVLITRMSKLLGPYKLLSGSLNVYGMDRIMLFISFSNGIVLTKILVFWSEIWRSASFLDARSFHFYLNYLLHKCENSGSCSRSYYI